MSVRRSSRFGVRAFTFCAIFLLPAGAIGQERPPGAAVSSGVPALDARVRALEELLARSPGLRSYDDLHGSPCTSAAGRPSIVLLLGRLRTPVCGEVSQSGRYIDYGAVVADTQTNLMWEKKDHNSSLHFFGSTYWWCHASGDVTGICANVNPYSWIADVNGEQFEGFTDWRLPSREELLTIVDTSMPGCAVQGNGGPCIDPIFGPTQRNAYWSSTAAPDDFAWAVDFWFGEARNFPRLISFAVRAVRTLR